MSSYTQQQDVEMHVQPASPSFPPQPMPSPKPKDGLSEHQKQIHHYRILLFLFFCIIVALLIVIFTQVDDKGASVDVNTATVELLVLNDVTEAEALFNDSKGGLHRIATLKKNLKANNPNVFAVLPGNTFIGSPLNDAWVNGTRVAGRHMIDLWNLVGLDFANLGEDDLKMAEADLKARLNESKAKWISSNINKPGSADSFTGLAYYEFQTTSSSSSPAVMNVSIISFTSDENQPSFATVQNASASITTAKTLAAMLKKRNDIVIALTHWPQELDYMLATNVPQIDLILGGHEHDNFRSTRGDHRSSPTVILKSDSNAQNVFRVTISFNNLTRTFKTTDQLVAVNSAITPDPTVKARMTQWYNLAFQNMSGWTPARTVCNIKAPADSSFIDGLQSSVRSYDTALTQLVRRAITAASVQNGFAPNVTLFSSVLLGVDDVIPPGPISEYEVMAMFPYGGSVVTVNMTGQALRVTLVVGSLLEGHEQFIHHDAQFGGSTWDLWVNGHPIDPNAIYVVATTDQMLSATAYPMFTMSAKTMSTAATQTDIRRAMISQLQREYGTA